MDSIRILIADDHPLYRDGLHGLLDSVPDTEVVGEAMDGKEAIALANNLQPDVILMDLKMPGVNGLEAMREILNASPHIRILVIGNKENQTACITAICNTHATPFLRSPEKGKIVRSDSSVVGCTDH